MRGFVVLLYAFFIISGCSSGAKPDTHTPVPQKSEPSSGTKLRTAEKSSPRATAGVFREFSGKPLLPPQERPESLSWGRTEPSGLQLGVWVDPHQSALWAVIRNPGDLPVRYNDYLLGDWQSVSIKARRNSQDAWQAVDRIRKKHRACLSAGAGPVNVHVLNPGEEMRIRHFGEEKPLLPLHAPRYTFDVDLRDFDWPDSWSGQAEVIVLQKLAHDSSEGTWEVTLESGPINVRVEKEATGDEPSATVPAN